MSDQEQLEKRIDQLEEEVKQNNKAIQDAVERVEKVQIKAKKTYKSMQETRDVVENTHDNLEHSKTDLQKQIKAVEEEQEQLINLINKAQTHNKVIALYMLQTQEGINLKQEDQEILDEIGELENSPAVQKLKEILEV